ncbi:MAG: basic amino acid ABC transporter substrate-binding protein [Lachnospiraceae bacterium]|nr:basic amino acid ABC transporter substrate-binding protein [Lachnospiraceae bacterium]
MKKVISLILTGVLAVSLLAGCGSSKSEASGGTKVDSAALADGVLTVGTNAEFPPFEYVGDDGQPDGFDMALIKAIGEKLGVEVVVENMEFDSLVSSIGSKTDVAIAGMTVTEERQQSVDFSEPYYSAVQHVLIPADSTIATYDDLVGKTIGCQLGTTGDFIIEEIEGATDQQYNKAVDAVNDLVNGRLDAVIVDSNPAGVFASNFPDKVKDLNGEDFGFGIEEYAIALPKGDTELKEAIDVAITTLKEDGTFDKLVDQYME